MGDDHQPMSWRPSAKKVEAIAREMTAADLLASEGRAYAFCPSCRVWRRVRLKRLFEHERRVALVRLAGQMRCVVCEHAPVSLRLSDAYHNRAELRL
jgi:hypothetical protein